VTATGKGDQKWEGDHDGAYRPGPAMSVDYTGRVALVTGGASGIGAATAARLRAAGATVHTLDVTALTSGDSGRHAVVDVTDEQRVRDAIAAVGSEHARIDLLVNNAGIGAIGTVEDGDLAEWRRVLDVNVFGVVHATRAALPFLRQSQGRAIVNVCSLAALVGLAKRAVYSASKGAVYALTLSMAADLLDDRIRVNAVAPGTIGTPWVDRLLAAADDREAERARLEARQPIGRLGTADEIGAVIAFLGSADASFVNGSVWTADGGMASLRTPPRLAAPA
jgi:NAD(P)-dependent dehydrogenase (short-subunit alcohol dehydrogenase family)